MLTCLLLMSSVRKLPVRCRRAGIGAAFGGGSGLVGLKDRVEALGGRFSMQPAPDTGTTVHAEFPLGRPTGVPG